MTKTKSVLCILLAAFVACGVSYLLLRPAKRTFQGRDMNQWLAILETNTNSVDSPLKIMRITNDSESGFVNVEVPLSYDLLKKNDLLEKHGKIGLIINGYGQSAFIMHATSENLVLSCSANDFISGTNQIQVEFTIFNPSNRDRVLMATGPVARFVKYH